MRWCRSRARYNSCILRCAKSSRILGAKRRGLESLFSSEQTGAHTRQPISNNIFTEPTSTSTAVMSDNNIWQATGFSQQQWTALPTPIRGGAAAPGPPGLPGPPGPTGPQGTPARSNGNGRARNLPGALHFHRYYRIRHCRRRSSHHVGGGSLTQPLAGRWLHRTFAVCGVDANYPGAERKSDSIEGISSRSG